MKTQMIIGFLAIAIVACTDQDPVPVKTTTTSITDSTGRTYQTGDCSTNLAIIAVLERQNSLLRSRIILIRAGLVSDTGCDRMLSCTEALERMISFNLFQIQLLKQGC